MLTGRWLAVLLAVVVPSVAWAQRAVPSHASARWVRCWPGDEQGCLEVELELSRAEARRLGRVPVSRETWAFETQGWRPLVGPPERSFDVARPLRLLVVLDVSGSMIGDRLAFARAALRGFIGALPSEGIEVGLGTFESRDVARSVTGGAFEATRDAAGRVAALPVPRREGNTALYSALELAVTRVGTVVGQAGKDTWGGVVLLTDGVNDVGHAGDDPGLLSGPAGRTRAAAAVASAAEAGVGVWLIGVGGAERGELVALAGGSGEVFVVREDPNAMAEALEVIRGQLLLNRRLVVAWPGSTVSSPRPSSIVGRLTATTSDGNPEVSRMVAWRAPTVALPAFEGVADAARLPELLQAPSVPSSGLALRRAGIAAFFCVVLLGGWFLLPHLLWVAPAAAAVGTRSAASATAAKTEATAPPQSTPDRAEVAPEATWREAPPRRPDEITRDRARRVAKQA